MPIFSTVILAWLQEWYSATLKWQRLSGPEGNFVEAHTLLGNLFRGLEGSTIVVPNIEALSPVWKVDTNPFLHSVGDEYNEWVKQYVETHSCLDEFSGLSM